MGGFSGRGKRRMNTVPRPERFAAFGWTHPGGEIGHEHPEWK